MTSDGKSEHEIIPRIGTAAKTAFQNVLKVLTANRVIMALETLCAVLANSLCSSKLGYYVGEMYMGCIVYADDII